MTAATPAQSQVRRNVAAAPSRGSHAHAPAQSASRQAVQSSQSGDFSRPRGDDEINLNLADIPVMRGTLEVEGLKPSLLSRFFDLLSPSR